MTPHARRGENDDKGTTEGVTQVKYPLRDSLRGVVDEWDSGFYRASGASPSVLTTNVAHREREASSRVFHSSRVFGKDGEARAARTDRSRVLDPTSAGKTAFEGEEGRVISDGCRSEGGRFLAAHSTGSSKAGTIRIRFRSPREPTTCSQAACFRLVSLLSTSRPSCFPGPTSSLRDSSKWAGRSASSLPTRPKAACPGFGSAFPSFPWWPRGTGPEDDSDRHGLHRLDRDRRRRHGGDRDDLFR